MRSVLAVLIVIAVAAGCGRPQPEAPFIHAVRTNDVPTIQALVAAGADVNAIARNNWTPLLHAIHKGRLESVNALIAAGADVNKASPGGLSPLEMAAGNGQAPIVRKLLEAGANPRTPGVFAAAVSGGALSDIDRPILGQCNTEVVRALLQQAPDLRLPRNAIGHLSMLFAKWNQCTEVVALAQFKEG